MQREPPPPQAGHPPREAGQSHGTNRCNPQSLVASVADNGQGCSNGSRRHCSCARRGRSRLGVSGSVPGEGGRAEPCSPRPPSAGAPKRVGQGGCKAGHRLPAAAATHGAGDGGGRGRGHRCGGSQKHIPGAGCRVSAKPAGPGRSPVQGAAAEDALISVQDFLCRRFPSAAAGAGASHAGRTVNCYLLGGRVGNRFQNRCFGGRWSKQGAESLSAVCVWGALGWLLGAGGWGRRGMDPSAG